MGRPPGRRNRDYDQTRHALARRIAPHLLTVDGDPSSLTDLAAVAGVTPTTLRHYFGDRDGAYDAVMQAALVDSRRHLDAAADPGARSPEQSLTDLLAGAVEAWRRHGLGPLFAGGLSWSLGSGRRGPAFLSGVLEPFLQSTERLLSAHCERGELPDIDVRAAALSLVSPVVLALLHQDSLGGATARDLDVDAFARQHARTVLHGLSPRSA